ncbi:hypothetical protein ACIQVK_13645 [Streptomyces sp. NPDC090493]|uniref:hypothetical protein n=1 Tax=Streptomyces sp. NPDC090493 TaxID=3365964 RepID=UPI0037F6F312
MRSPEFAAMSSEHKVKKWDFATYRMHPPAARPGVPDPADPADPAGTGPAHRGRNCRSRLALPGRTAPGRIRRSHSGSGSCA